MTRNGEPEDNRTRAADRLLRVQIVGAVPFTSAVLPPPTGGDGLYNEKGGRK